MIFSDIFLLGDFFLPAKLKELSHKVRAATGDDSFSDEVAFQSLLENREQITELFRSRVANLVPIFSLALLLLSSLSLRTEMILPFLLPKISLLLCYFFILHSGKVSWRTSSSLLVVASLLSNYQMIWDPSSSCPGIPPFLHMYGTLIPVLPIVAMYLVTNKAVVPLIAAVIGGMIISFLVSVNRNGPVVWEFEQQLPFLVFGLIFQLAPMLVMKAIDEEARLYHSLLLRSLRNLEQRSQAKTTFISRMSHELRTPLQGLLSSSTLLKETKLTDDQMTYISIINSCGDLLLNIMEKILDITRIESGKFETQTQPFSLLNLVPSLLESVVGLSSAKGIDLLLNFDLTAKSYVVHGDQKHLKGILTNLIGNAVKFTEKGSVTVAVSVKEQTLRSPSSAVVPEKSDLMVYRFEVKDTGRGIPEKLLPNLFEPFTKAHNYHHNEGSGLGLSISKRFTEALGGKIGVETAVGVGSTFWVEIPFRPLDPNSIGPLLELPVLSPQQPLTSHEIKAIGVFVRAGILDIIGGYLGHWGLRFEIVDDIRQLKNYAYFIVEKRRLLETRGTPFSLTLPALSSSAPPLLSSASVLSLASETVLELLTSLSQGVFEKGIILTSFGSSHHIKTDLEARGFLDRISVIPEPLSPRKFAQGVAKMIGLVQGRNDPEASGSLFETDSPGQHHIIDLEDKTPSLAPSFSPIPSPLSPLLGEEEKLDVLLVEDNPVNQIVMRKQFEKLRINFAITGKAEESLVIWEKYPLGITLILMDIELDGPMTGLEATTIIRQKEMQSIRFVQGDTGSRHKQRIKSYIAIMTGRVLEEDRREAFSSGCDDFLAKPVSLEKVKDLISTLVLGKR